MWLAIPLNGGMNEFLIIITGSIFELSSEYDNEDWLLSGWWMWAHNERWMQNCERWMHREHMLNEWWMLAEQTQNWESRKFLGLYDMMTIYLHKLL